MKGNRLTQVYRGMKYYDIILQNGHVLIEAEVGGTLLIDTGSPMSFHRTGSFVIDEETFNVPTSLMVEAAVYEVPLTVGGEQFTMRLGVPPARVGAMMAACGLDGAIGMELLGRKAVLIADGGVWFRQDS